MVVVPTFAAVTVTNKARGTRYAAAQVMSTHSQVGLLHRLSCSLPLRMARSAPAGCARRRRTSTKASMSAVIHSAGSCVIAVARASAGSGADGCCPMTTQAGMTQALE